MNITERLNRFDVYRFVTMVAMVTMPAAAAINFGDAAYDALLPRTSEILAAIGGWSTGIGFETIGIVAGHRAINFHGKGDPRWKLAALALVAYMVIGVWEMFHIPFARFVPLLSGLVYILAGMQKDAETEAVTAVADKDYERRKELFVLKQQHELKMKEAELETQKKIEQAKARSVAKKVKVSQDGSQKVSQDSQEPTKHYECVCGRVFEGSRSYNAHRRHCEKPASEPVRVYANGYHK